MLIPAQRRALWPSPRGRCAGTMCCRKRLSCDRWQPGAAPNVKADTTLPELHQHLMGVISPVTADVASASQCPSVSSSARETGFHFLFIVSGNPRISLRACFLNTIDNYTDCAPRHRIPGAWAGAWAGPPWGSLAPGPPPLRGAASPLSPALSPAHSRLSPDLWHCPPA